MKVCVLGGSGMLGSMVAHYLMRDNDLEVFATARYPALGVIEKRLPGVTCIPYAGAANYLPKCEWFINCIGMTKPCIGNHTPTTIQQAIHTNSLMPYTIADKAACSKAHVIQIATDCVYSGDHTVHTGMYAETVLHDPLDVYGKTKSLGEVKAEHVHNLRCSIIGPEVCHKRHLLEWVRGQAKGATIYGYTDHLWNGITTLHFAKLCYGIIVNEMLPPNLQHIVPQDKVTKEQLLQIIAGAYNRNDITIEPYETGLFNDRTLATNEPAINAELWDLAGYDTPPTIADMIKELAEYDYLS